VHDKKGQFFLLFGAAMQQLLRPGKRGKSLKSSHRHNILYPLLSFQVWACCFISFPSGFASQVMTTNLNLQK